MNNSLPILKKTLHYLRSHPLLSLLPVVFLFLVMLASLELLSNATQNSAHFERHYLQLLIINILGVLILIGLIGFRIKRFIYDFRAKVIGSRLALRLITLFFLVSLIPVSAVYYFSLQFLEKGIDSWFDNRIEVALQDALELSRTSMDLRFKQLLDETTAIAQALQNDDQEIEQLTQLHRETRIEELTLLSTSGRVIANSALNSAQILPQIPDNAILMQVRQGYNYVALEPDNSGQLMVRIVTLVTSDLAYVEPRILQSLYTVPKHIGKLLDNVNDSFAYYKEMVFLRDPLKNSFILTLSLVLLLTLLTAIWIALFSTHRLVEPIRILAQGTRAVAAGDYTQQLPLTSYDEFGSLVNSFNDMTKKIAQARDEVSRSQQQTDHERAYLRAVLGGLTSGVITLDHRYKIRSANTAARKILAVNFEPFMGKRLILLAEHNENMNDFINEILQNLSQETHNWQAQITLFTQKGRKVLMCHGTRLTEDHRKLSGYVLVLDDITEVLQAQRDAAWSEVARRLAHEIKNPLTPIQLAAERMRRRYLNILSADEGQLLDRSTHTIIQQVEAMEEMVRAFSDYAYTPKRQLGNVDLNQLIDEVLELYRGNQEVSFKQDLDPNINNIYADKGRLRQLLHNLIKNAVEAVTSQENAQITVSSKLQGKTSDGYVELQVTDNGPGISEALLKQLFEPYITNKPKGSGLGLAIVKKIIEEHGGIVKADNQQQGGAAITLHLPLDYERKDTESSTLSQTVKRLES